MTVLGYAGVFMVFTYITALLTGIAGIEETRISFFLLLFACALAITYIPWLSLVLLDR